MIDLIIFIFQAGILETILSFDYDLFSVVSSTIIVVALWVYAFIKQGYYRNAFKKGTGLKRYSGYVNYHFTVRYLFLFLTILLMKQDNNFALSIVFLYVGWKAIWDIIMKNMVKKETELLTQNLTSDSKIIILQKDSCLFPGGFWRRLYDIVLFPLLIRFGDLELQGTYQKYIAISNITALICEDLITPNHKYMYINSHQFRKIYCSSSKLRRKRMVVQPLYHACDRYLIAKHPDISFDNPNIPYSKEKLQIFETELRDSNWISHMIKTIEMISKESTELDMKFRPFLSYETRDRGKLYVQSMIRNMLNTQQNDTEYFYSLLKINEFIIHYQALADYETAKEAYWAKEDCTPSIGVLANNITDTKNTELLKDKEFREAVKFLHYISTNHSEKFPSKRASAYAREQIVVLRNRYTGHGTMTYSVSLELLRQFALVTQVLTEQFFSQEENMMLHNKVTSIDKWVEKDSCLYLLSALYRSNGAYQYLDYATGQTLSMGNPLTIRLCRNVGGTQHE